MSIIKAGINEETTQITTVSSRKYVLVLKPYRVRIFKNLISDSVYNLLPSNVAIRCEIFV